MESVVKMNLIPSLLSVIITFFFKLNFLQFQDFTIGLFTLSGDFVSDIVSFLVQYFIVCFQVIILIILCNI